MRTYIQNLQIGIAIAALGGFGLDTLSSSFALDTSLVSEPGGVGVNQDSPTLTATAHGSILLYECQRTGVSEYRISSVDHYGNPRHPSTDIQGLLSPLGLARPILASNVEADRTVLLWRNAYESTLRIVRIDPITGAPIGDPVNLLEDEDTPNSTFREKLLVADDGICLLIYKLDDQIRARLFDTEFSPLGPSFVIGESANFGAPGVAFHADGSFTIAWNGELPPYFIQVRSQRYAANGTPLGPINNHTPDDIEIFVDASPVVGARPDGSSLIAWIWADGIQAQALDTYGVLLDSPQVVVPSDLVIEDPGMIAPDDSGNWMLIQNGGSTYNDHVAFTLVDGNNLTPLYHNELDDLDHNTCAWSSSQQALLFAWQMREGTDEDIAGQLFQTDGAPLAEIATLSDDVDGAHQVYPRSDGNHDGRSIVAWHDHRTGMGQIYFQLYDSDGSPIGSNQLVVGNSTSLSSPQISMNESGEFAIAWYETPSEIRSAFVQRYTAAGDPIGSTITASLSDDAIIGYLKLELFDDGSMIIAWTDSDPSPDSRYKLQARRFDSSGTPMTSNAPVVNVDAGNRYSDKCFEIVPLSNGDAWLFYLLNDSIRMREFSASGTPTGPVHVLSPDGGSWAESAIGDDDGFSVAWSTDFGDHLYVDHYDANATLIASELLDEADDLESPTLGLTQDGTRVLLHNTPTWNGGGWDDHIQYRQYDATGTPIGEPTAIPTLGIDGWFLTGNTPATIFSNEIVLAYSIPSGTDQGLDIMRTSVDLQPCSTGDYNCDGRVDGFDLSHLLGSWGLAQGDLDGDGTTNGVDLTILLGAWTG